MDISNINDSNEVKYELMSLLTSYISDKGMSQKEAAIIMGCSQPRVSNLINGHIDKFSVDMIITMLIKIGYSISLSKADDGNSLGINFIYNK